MTTTDCDCPGCVYDGNCYYPRGITGQAPWTADTLDPIDLPERVVGLIQELSGNDETPPATREG